MQFSAIRLITGNAAYFEKEKKELSTSYPIQIDSQLKNAIPYVICLNRAEANYFFNQSTDDYTPEVIAYNLLKNRKNFLAYLSKVFKEKKTFDKNPILISEINEKGNVKQLHLTGTYF